jgi:hypothetical protein
MEKVNSQKKVDTNISENDKTETTFKRCDMCKSAEDTYEICKKRPEIDQRRKEAITEQDFQAKKDAGEVKQEVQTCCSRGKCKCSRSRC